MVPSVPERYDESVFVNCPFDKPFTELLRPLLFVVVYWDHTPRLASESSDSGENRLDKICRLIASCRYSIHDLSRIKSSKENEFYRMNMPFELGIDFGTRRHGPEHARKKQFLILEQKPHDFKIALSDLAGVDIKAHANDPLEMIGAVRDWYYDTVGVDESKPKEHYWPSEIEGHFTDFAAYLFNERLAHGVPQAAARRDVARMPITEFIGSARDWIATNVASEDVSTR